MQNTRNRLRKYAWWKLEKNVLTENAIAINVAWRQKISRKGDNFDLRWL